MGKTPLAIAICSLSIVVVFCAMVYLMSKINPPPLDNTIRFKDEPPIDDIQGSPAASTESAPYVLDIDEAEFYTKRPGPYQNRGRKVVPPIWPRRNHKIVVTTPFHKVMPPIWPTTSMATVTSFNRPIKPEQYDIPTEEPLSSNKSIVKLRKSRSNYMLHEDLGSIILKILNNSGKSRIEIKLRPEGCFQKKKLKGIKRGNNKTVFIAKRDDNDHQQKHQKMAKDTVISICANDSIVIDESESLNTSELIDSIITISTGNVINNVTNITDIDKSVKQIPLSQNISDKVLDNNKTKSFENITKNFSNIDANSTSKPITNINHNSIAVIDIDTINDTKIFEAMKNMSDFDANNTEFNKIVFDEEDIDSITSRTSNAPNNNTNIYNENDNDTLY